MAVISTQNRKAELTRERPAEPHRPPAPARRRAVYYPTGDGKPVAETDKHITVLLDTRSRLRLRYQSRPDSVYVGGNNFLYYEEGNPRACVSPDGYVVFGVPQRERDSFKTWEEGGRTPAVVFEFTSKKTQAEDMAKKYHLYEQVLKVPEYILFDPTGDYLDPPLRGYRLVDGKYVPIEVVDGRLYSEQLGLELIVDGFYLRFHDPVTGRDIPNLPQAEAQRALAEEQKRIAEARAEAAEQREQAADARADAEAEARSASDREIERLRAEVEALRRL